MEVHWQIRELLAATRGQPAFSDLTPQAARLLLDQMTAARPAISLPKLRDVRNITITGPGGDLTLRHYRPLQVPIRGTLIYLHGGGWVLGSPDTCDPICRILADESGCDIYSVDYRLAPEFPFPAGLDDAFAAVTWAANHARTMPLFIGGDSAGGNLAAACCLRAREARGPKLSGQLLLYPVTDHNFQTLSYRKHGAKDLMVTAKDMLWYWRHYVADEMQSHNPLVSPLRAATLSGLPSALVVVAGFDPLCDEGEAYARRLRTDGTPVELRRYDDMVHGFLGLIGLLDAANDAARLAGKWVLDRT